MKNTKKFNLFLWIALIYLTLILISNITWSVTYQFFNILGYILIPFLILFLPYAFIMVLLNRKNKPKAFIASLPLIIFVPMILGSIFTNFQIHKYPITDYYFYSTIAITIGVIVIYLLRNKNDA